jgi:hypothetical protein
VVDAGAMPARGLVGNAYLENGLVLGRERRLLPMPLGLGLVELAVYPADDEPVPLALEIRILRFVMCLSAADRRQYCHGLYEQADRIFVVHGRSPVIAIQGLPKREGVLGRNNAR